MYIHGINKESQHMKVHDAFRPLEPQQSIYTMNERK